LNKSTRAAVAGSLSAYVRNGEIFTRPAPNTFGLIEFGGKVETSLNGPPRGFGFDGEPEAGLDS
jgi:hypothetical protein